MDTLAGFIKLQSLIQKGRINRSQARVSGAARTTLTLHPDLRGETSPVPDRNRVFDAIWIANEALRTIELDLPGIDRAFAGYGRDGDKIVLDKQQYELALCYCSFAIRDDEQEDLSAEKMSAFYIRPCAISMARLFTSQSGLRHLITRRLEPVRKPGVQSSFAFHNDFGIRAMIGYRKGVPIGTTMYVIDMLAGFPKGTLPGLFSN